MFIILEDSAIDLMEVQLAELGFRSIRYLMKGNARPVNVTYEDLDQCKKDYTCLITALRELNR